MQYKDHSSLTGWSPIDRLITLDQFMQLLIPHNLLTHNLIYFPCCPLGSDCLKHYFNVSETITTNLIGQTTKRSSTWSSMSGIFSVHWRKSRCVFGRVTSNSPIARCLIRTIYQLLAQTDQQMGVFNFNYYYYRSRPIKVFTEMKAFRFIIGD